MGTESEALARFRKINNTDPEFHDLGLASRSGAGLSCRTFSLPHQRLQDYDPDATIEDLLQKPEVSNLLALEDNAYIITSS